MRRGIRAFFTALALVFSSAAWAATSDAPNAAPFGPPVEDQNVYYHALFDQLEGRFGQESGFRWEGEARAGTDMNRLWLKSEGETGVNGQVEDGQHEFLYDRPISTFFDLQAGIRSDIDSRPGRNWFAFGVEGLAPLFFHVSATGYASSQNHFAGKLEGDYDLLLTQQLILQPQFELNLYSEADPARFTGRGLADLDSGLRLRYEFSRKFAPYFALTYETKFGESAHLVRTAGESASALRFTVGIRTWL